METRTQQLNKYYHAHLQDFHSQARARYMTVLGFDQFKQELKKLDEHYPKQDGKVISTAKCTNKQLCEHIEFVLAFAGYYGITTKISAAEWDRLLKQIH